MLHCSPPQSSKPNQELSQEHTPSPPAPPQHLSGEPAMLHSVEFLCSFVTAFARLAHVLCEALMSLCSPTSSPGPAGLPPPLKRVHPVATVVGRIASKELVAAPPAVVGTAECNGNAMRAEERKAARRPARLVIPASCAGTDPFGGAGAGETDVAGDVVVEGEEFWLASRRGVRHAMEDGYGVITDKINGDSKLAFYGVYDGHGGRAAVDFISDRLGKNIVSALAVIESQRSQDQQQLQDDQLEMMAVRAGYLTTDREFLSQGARGGACAATALVKDGELYVANVGDCRAVLSSGGVATALTTDHSAAGEDERARIESSGGYVSCNNGVWRVQGCLAVSRAFGDADMKQWVICEPEIKRLHLTAGCEFLVIASDGLWVKVSNQEAVDAVKRSNGKSMESCKELLNMARSRGSRDDITVMVVDLQRFVQ